MKQGILNQQNLIENNPVAVKEFLKKQASQPPGASSIRFHPAADISVVNTLIKAFSREKDYSLEKFSGQQIDVSGIKHVLCYKNPCYTFTAKPKNNILVVPFDYNELT